MFMPVCTGKFEKGVSIKFSVVLMQGKKSNSRVREIG